MTLTAPHGLPDQECVAIRRLLDSKRFQARLRRALGQVCRQHPVLRRVRLQLSR